MRDLRVNMRDLRVIWGPVQEGHSEAISGPYLDPFWTLSRKPHENHGISLHLAMGRALRLNIVKYGS